MGTWQLPLVGLVMLLGVVGTVVPGAPGPLLVWAGVLWWAMTERGALSWWLLMGATALLLTNLVVQWLLPARSLRASGARRRALLLAGATGAAGFFLVPVLGVVPGFLGGLYAHERHRLGGHGAARSSTRAVMRAIGRNMLVEETACLLVVGGWLGVVLGG
ncbi:DUF456 domain-containing protein [Streptomyces sp. JJ36]|uniref:DUF456 domain-containing protein n=1 Tax=Streptomyces sp. JJ36 TaxID=2736645 RepID=UPI001F29A316|nr:DUF456 domain-containing protein [Streptomyces sp. JJ36]MCF6525511.1 DUF456 domain-containing protein [Streptomyces sp. JJ36]